jgi:hypothetical protein
MTTTKNLNEYSVNELETEILNRRKQLASSVPWCAEDPDYSKITPLLQDYLRCILRKDSYYEIETIPERVFEEVMRACYGNDYWDWERNFRDYG